MQRENDDDAWRSIVDNYGDRPEIDPGEAPAPSTDPEPGPAPAPAEQPTWDVAYPDADWSQERFVPPPPPPVPSTTPDRLAAWIGIFGSPTVLLLCLVLGIPLPQIVAYLLVVSFVGGFLYLVVQMPRGPRDPDDNGARI